MSLPCVPVPAAGFHKNPGALPDRIPPDTLVRVQWACGYIDEKHTYKVSHLRWKLTGHPFDVGAIALCN